MRRGLAIYTVLLLIAAIWLPLANAQEAPTFEFSPELGDDLGAFGKGYVENLMLWSGAGVDLRWGPSFGGNQTALDARIAELEAAAGGTMPPNTTPLVVPFADAGPAFAAPAPINHSEMWMWNKTGLEARVNLGSVAATITAETDLAAQLMEGDALDAEGLLMVLSALEAARFMDERLGYDGVVLGPINMSDPNMTDTNASNGWWLPVWQAMGHVNVSAGDAWENEVIETANLLDGSWMALRALLDLGNYLSASDFLVGAGMPFPAGTDTEIMALANAVHNNIMALYYHEGADMFLQDGDAGTGSIALTYMALVDVSDSGNMVEYTQGWARSRAMRMADLLVGLQNEDGTMEGGYSTAIGGAPEAYIPPYLPIPGVTGHVAHALAAAALFDASDRFGGMAFMAAAKACLAADDANHWLDDENVYVQDPVAETTEAHSGDQVAALGALKAAVEHGDVDLARYRIASVWGGMVASGLQLSETDATGENYSIPEPDTDNDTIWKHDWDKGLGNPHGIAPVVASSSSVDAVTGNWSVDDGGRVNTHGLMAAAAIFMAMDGDWFTDMGDAEHSEEYARMLVHMSPEELLAWGEAWRVETENLTDRVRVLEGLIDNGTVLVDELMAQIASLEENISAMQKDLNESLENESILRNQTEWLREKLEEANETIDDLEHQMTVLESKVERLEESAVWNEENITRLEEDLRRSRYNVTQLQFQLDNASAALARADLDLAAAQKELEDTKADYDELQTRTLLTAIVAFLVGMVVVVALFRLRGKV